MSTISLEDGKLVLEYSLVDLPTAQHKAGLAGLLVMIESLKQRRKGPLPEAAVIRTGARLCFSQEAMQLVFDDLFDARWVEVESGTKWPKQTPKRVEEKEAGTNVKKTVKRFIYDAVQPAGSFLQTFYPDSDGLWVNLWRDMLWNILRGIPATRNVYEERANKMPSSEGKNTWTSFSKALEQHQKGKLRNEPLSSSLFIGAEAANPERVPFYGTAEHNFLLNFWPLVSLIYVSRELKIERADDRLRINRRNEDGFVLAIPEPQDIEAFVEDVIEVLRSLDAEVSGFRPRASLIDVFEESGLECLYSFARKRVGDNGQFTFNLRGLEIYHLQRQGNRIRQLAGNKILPRSDIISDYEKVRESLRNPFYKRFYLCNLLSGLPWYTDADRLFHCEPMAVFIKTGRTPTEVRFFGRDVKEKFKAVADTLALKKGGNMTTEKDHDDQLSLRVHRLVQNYVRRKTEEKSKKKYDEFKNNKNDKGAVVYPAEYRDALEKVCADAFLAMRSRREQDFIEYFTGTICSVPQFLPEAEYLSVAKDLMENWQKIKTLSMLSISANSYLSDQS